MPNDAEIIRSTVDEFQKVQMHMKNAKDESAEPESFFPVLHFSFKQFL